MADQDLPEPSSTGSGRGKQIVFLFMSAVVVAVVIFLLGVSVGRGVKGSDAGAGPEGSSAAAAPPETTSAATPPAQASPGDLNYHNSVRAGTPAGPPPADDKTAALPPVPAPTTPPPPVNDAPPVSGAKATKTPAPAAPATNRRGEYFVQVGAYRTMSAAQTVVTKVKAANAGYAVTTVTMPESAPPPRFKVMVGPYSSADDARAVIARLKKQGFVPFLKR
jgi:cell division protein FtsN